MTTFFINEVSLHDFKNSKLFKRKTKQNKIKQKQMSTLTQLQVSKFQITIQLVRFCKSEFILRRTELGYFR